MLHPDIFSQNKTGTRNYKIFWLSSGWVFGGLVSEYKNAKQNQMCFNACAQVSEPWAKYTDLKVRGHQN